MTLFAFTDIETTGLHPGEDDILEIAWQITDGSFEVVRPMRSFIVEHDQETWGEIWAALAVNPYVDAMHTKSGLKADLLNRPGHSLDAIAMAFRDDAEQAGALKEGESLHLAGFSVGFDRSFLAETGAFGIMLNTDMFGFQIHHRLLDLSAVKMMFDAADVPWEKAANEGAHRARNDVQESIDQARIFRESLAGMWWAAKGGNKTSEEAGL